ncbi:MogA/MoaB family molybdenum cofactor biosynthesis protein [bacterium]|nr:MogA/MoaB family molybdenum cofactor biosynthesis protein [bacterium]
MRVLVLTISDRASVGVYEDRSGPAVEESLSRNIPDAEIERQIVPDEKAKIEEVLSGNLDKDVIITTGGTGLGPRDITPDVTIGFCDRLIPGIAEYLRTESLKETLNAVLSRGVAGIKDQTIIINLPGSVKGASFCAELLPSILRHALAMVHGEGH